MRAIDSDRLLMTRRGRTRRVDLPVSDRYKSACASYIRKASKRPEMFFRSLDDLGHQMHGHAVAYVELGALSDYDDRFNRQFGNWLYENYQLSCSCGWADAIEDSTESKDQAEARFFEFVEQFLEQW